MDLLAYAKTYTTPDGEVTFWLMPYRSTLAAMAEKALEGVKPNRAEWDHIDNFLVGVVPATLKMEFTEPIKPHRLAMRDFWLNWQKMTIEERQMWIGMVMTMESLDEWSLAYLETRTNPAPADEALGQEKPTGNPNGSERGSGRTATTKSSSSRSSSRISKAQPTTNAG